MAYWGGGGVEGDLHPSLQTYVDCFESPPFPKMYPRGGGPHNQDPVLMRDFRTIRSFAVKWRDNQRALEETTSASQQAPEGSGMEAALEAMLEEMGEDGHF